VVRQSGTAAQPAKAVVLGDYGGREDHSGG
jgi:hypothetical protein